MRHMSSTYSTKGTKQGNIDSYVTALRNLAKSCDCLNDTLIRDRIVFGV